MLTKDEELLLKELKAARLALRKVKAECNEYDEGYAVCAKALKRINSVMSDYRQPTAHGVIA